MKFVVTFCAAFFLCVGVRAQDEKNLENSYRFYNGVMLYAMGEDKDAAAVLGYNFKMDSTHSPSLYYLAKIAYDRGSTSGNSSELEHARRFAQFAIDIDSTELDYRLLLGQIYVSMGRYADAQQVFDYLTSRQNDPQYKRLSAALLVEMGEYDKAISICNSFEKQYGIDQDVAEVKYLAMMRAHQYYELEPYLSQVTSAFPLNTRFLIALAEINTTLRHDSTAIANYNQAIAVDSTQADSYIALARYYQYKNDTKNYIATLIPYFKLKDADVKAKIEIFERDFFTPAPYKEHYAAIRHLASALLLSSQGEVEVQMLYGRFLTYTNQIDAAFDFYNSMSENSVKSEDIYSRMGEILMYRKDFARADSLFQSAIAHYPKSVDITQFLIVAKWLSGNTAGALKLADQAIRSFKSDSIRSNFYAVKGDIYHELGDSRRCYSAYDKALKLNNGNAIVLNNYAYFLALEARHLEWALKMATRACEISSANPTYLDTKAWVLFTMGKYSQALQVQQAALGLDTDKSPDLLLHYGDMLYANGDDFLARTYWQRALDAGADKGSVEQRLARPKAINSR